MSSETSTTSKLSLVLHFVTIGLLAYVLIRDRGPEAQAEDEESTAEILEGYSDEISSAAYELRNQANRLARTLDKMQREGLATTPAPKGGISDAPDADVTALRTDDLVARLREVDELHEQFKNDPIQRVPVESERGRIEEELRGRGDEAVDAISAIFLEVPNTRHQTRMLTHVIDPIGTDHAMEFARAVFRDEQVVGGVRLVGAQIALKRWPEEINRDLVGLLSDLSIGFKRLEQVIVFFKQNPYPPAAAPLCAIAKNTDVDRLLRRFAMQSLANYPEPKVIESLKEIAQDASQVDLRAEAIQSLNRILGEDVLDFLRFLRTQLTDDDAVHSLIDNIEFTYQEQAAAGGR